MSALSKAMMVVLATAGVKGVTAQVAEDAALTGLQGWRYGMPDSGVAPVHGSFEWFTRMGERHGGSELSLQSYALTVPLSDPRKTGWGETMLNIQFDAKVTVVNTGGTLDLHNDVFYNFALPVTFITPVGNGNRWTYGLAPELAADCESTAKGLDFRF